MAGRDAPKMETTHPFLKSIDNLNEIFNESWPPRSHFEQWPSFINIYQESCDKVPKKLGSSNDTTQFRQLID